jgi:NADPH:quinone reductase-like Zn-dependent oxidoreductase
VKAARIHAYGDADELRVEDIEPPVVGPRDVLVEVHASSVNPIDTKIRAGAQRAVVRKTLPAVLGMDVSGVVVEVGAEVTRFGVGDAVWSSPTHRRQGTYAELVAIDERECAPKPEILSHLEAASLPLVALTAWDCLVTAGKVRAGQRVLIHAGAGGVGTVAIQLAKHLGAEVSTTCSAGNVELVTSLGANRAIDYRAERFEEVLTGLDLVLESLGGDSYWRSLKVLRRGGVLTTINTGLPAAVKRYGAYLGVAAVALRLGGAKLASRIRYGVKTSVVVRAPSGDNLARIGALVDQGAIRPVVAEIMPLERIADAHRANESGRTRGKIVISLRD